MCMWADERKQERQSSAQANFVPLIFKCNCCSRRRLYLKPKGPTAAMSIDGLTAEAAEETQAAMRREQQAGLASGAVDNISSLQVITSISSLFLTRSQNEGNVQDLIVSRFHV